MYYLNILAALIVNKYNFTSAFSVTLLISIGLYYQSVPCCKNNMWRGCGEQLQQPQRQGYILCNIGRMAVSIKQHKTRGV